jgi:Mg-chelatase subunit ChlD
VVVCTDGLANVGLGSFDEIKTEEECKKVDEFYEILGQFAMEKGVTVNIISIEGEECNIDTLSKISQMTGGTVDRVNPIQLTQNFSNILSLPVLATKV